MPEPHETDDLARVTDWFLRGILPHLDKIPPDMLRRVIEPLEHARRKLKHDTLKSKFLPFVNTMMPKFQQGEHHVRMAEAIDRIVAGSLKRLIVAAPPRSTKSTFFSTYLPAYYLGHYPDRFIMQLSNNKRLASKFGDAVQEIVRSPEYLDIFPDVQLSRTTRSKQVFNTNRRGRYIAESIGSKIAGEGGHLIVIDDPHSEQDVLKAVLKKDAFQDEWEWFNGGPRQRKQPGAAIVIVMTRWSANDISGRALREKAQGVEDWEVIEIPAIIDEHTPNERSFFPGPGNGKFGWPLEELQKQREVMPIWKWAAQYQQRPMNQSANIINRDWWKNWTATDNLGNPVSPACQYVIQVWDTAIQTTDISNYSACTTWGVFTLPLEKETTAAGSFARHRKGILLLHAQRGRWPFPELKERARGLYNKYKPDTVIVEAKNSGQALIDEMIQSRIPITPYVPTRRSRANPGDKMSRLAACADIFRDGVVWAPKAETWAGEVIEEVASAPYGDNDDFADTVEMAIRWFRNGGFIQLTAEIEQDEKDAQKQQPQYEGAFL